MLIPWKQIRKNLIQGSALLEAWNIEPTELAKEVDTGDISSGKLIPYDSEGNLYPRLGRADLNYDAAFYAWFRLEDVLGLFSIERLSPEDRATVIDYLPERNSSLTAKNWVSWQDLVRIQPPFEILKAIKNCTLKPVDRDTGAEIGCPYEFHEYKAVFDLGNRKNSRELQQRLQQRLSEIYSDDSGFRDVNIRPIDAKDWNRLSWKYLHVPKSELTRLIETCLKNAVFSASEVDQAFSREPSDDDDGAKMKPRVTLAQSRWDRFFLKAAELRKDDDEITIEEIIKDPLVLQIWPSKDRPQESTLKHKLEGSGITKRGRRKADKKPESR